MFEVSVTSVFKLAESGKPYVEDARNEMFEESVTSVFKLAESGKPYVDRAGQLGIPSEDCVHSTRQIIGWSFISQKG